MLSDNRFQLLHKLAAFEHLRKIVVSLARSRATRLRPGPLQKVRQKAVPKIAEQLPVPVFSIELTGQFPVGFDLGTNSWTITTP